MDVTIGAVVAQKRTSAHSKESWRKGLAEVGAFMRGPEGAREAAGSQWG